MSTDDEKRKEQEELIQREIILERKFTLADAIGREGGSLIKGHSPVPKLDQIITEINIFIRNNLKDSSRILMSVLQNKIRNDGVKISKNIEKPFEYFINFLKSYIKNPHLLYELVREVDFQWGQTYNEKPYFQKLGEPPHPDDEYSHEIVREKLSDLLEKTEKIVNQK